ncbi:MAG: type IV toxin-antitoxin system AbiEi family antitoxin [Cytophagales bacterium]|nr:type IV toxin-antitoxin system AbiEi family antitoxin [Cytophagales bacterium]
MRPTHKKSVKINYITKSTIQEKYLDQKKTETGYIKVSSPELTALDLFRYEKRVGGLNRIGTILNELTEEFEPERINDEFVKLSSASSIQRLGYMLDIVLENQQYADKLFDACQKANIRFNRIPLDGEEETLGFSSGNRWNIIVNTEIEIDE